jgi:hypothetical protein
MTLFETAAVRGFCQIASGFHCLDFTAAICLQIKVVSLGSTSTTRMTTNNKQTNSVVLVRELTLPTERPPLVGEVSAKFCG